ncbi:MAG: bifunctional riboflavin kinase/FAD synthetase [Acetatifactor sp.]|nr:bifunctional riboflavin kinase/FAD synthetase [Acetatifactor sp.]
MEIIAGTTDFYLEKETAVAIGKFDGVHIGHRRLLEEILSQKRSGLAACVFTFDPAPSVLFGRSDGRELTTREEKRVLFERMGIDILVEFPLTMETAAMEPECFVREILAERMNTRFLAAGTDLSFGAGGRGNASLLESLSPQLEFCVKIIGKVCVDGKEVSSSLIRNQVEQGDMPYAGRLLGMPYPIMGSVVHGNRIGRTLGFPTINLLPPPDKLLPPNGVYLSDVTCGGRKYHAISNVGCKPTVTEELVMGVETYLYDFDGELYGEFVEIYLKEFKRPERKFDSLEALKEQLAQDIKIM